MQYNHGGIDKDGQAKDYWGDGEQVVLNNITYSRAIDAPGSVTCVYDPMPDPDLFIIEEVRIGPRVTWSAVPRPVPLVEGSEE